MSTVVLAPSYTLLGKLQRGLGAGFLEATRIDRDQAQEFALACLDEEPRREPGEARGRYYGELCLATRVDLRELAARVEAADAVPATRRLVLETVGWLAWRGVEGPMAMLRDYIRGGGEEAVLALSCLWHPRALAGLGDALLERYPTPEALAVALGAGGADPRREPWAGWSVRRPVIANAFALVQPPASAEPDVSIAAGQPLALLEQLGVALERDECVCALARGLSDSSNDAFALLERAFRSTTRSSCRVTIAEELARTSATFPARAAECLWDAEPGVVAAAASVVPLDAPGVVERLERLAQDGLAVAAGRLALSTQ